MYGYTSVERKGAVDLEAGGSLYPGLSHGENQLRWGFIRKVYGILAFQILLTTIVSSFTVLHPSVNQTLQGSPGLALFLAFVPLIWTIVLQALILTSAVVVSLTAYTFWASKRGKDFSFLGPVLFAGLIILVMASFIQIFFPFGSTSNIIFGACGALIFSGYLVYDTDNLIKRFTYDEYIWASVILYLDILNMFLYLLNLLRSSES